MMKPPQTNGFTLIEIMVALAASSILLAVGMFGFQEITSNMRKMEQASMANDEAKLLNEYMISSLQSAGGGGVRPWHAISVIDNWNGDGSDLLDFFEIDPDSPECSVTARLGDQLDFNVITDPTICDGGATACCCVDMDGDSTLDAAWSGLSVLAVDSNGKRFPVVVTPTTLNTSYLGTPFCRLNFSRGFQSSMHINGADPFVPPGTIAVGLAYRYKLDFANKILLYELDRNQDGDVNDAGEVVQITDRVYDFQVALGYDITPQDGKVDDTANQADEWYRNHTADAWDANGLAGVERTDLRMIGVGLTVGAPLGQLRGELVYSKPIYNGPTRTATRTVFRSVVGKAYLRNLDIMR